MATFGTLKTRVAGYLIDNPSFTTALIGDWINKAIDDAEGRHNFRHMKQVFQATTTAGTRKLADLPSNWKEERDPPYALHDDGTTREMAWAASAHMMRRQFATGDTTDDGDPRYLLLHDEGDTSELWVYPFMDGASDYVDGEYRIHVPYWAYSAPLSADGDTNWWTDNWEWYLTFYAAAEGFLANRDTQEATIYIERAEAERQKAVRRSKQQQLKSPNMLVPRRDVYGIGRKPPGRL